MKRNHLLAKPPHSFHNLRDTQWFRRMVGRAPRQSDYDGVHTASDRSIAAAYAMSAWRQSADDSYPIVITLDVSGLEALPDVDAMVRGGEAADMVRSDYRSRYEAGEGLDDFIDDQDYREVEASVGDEPAAFLFEDQGSHVFQAIRDYAEASSENEHDIFEQFMKKGDLPGGVLTRLARQQRYMADFDLDRVVRIEAIRPWWDHVLASYDDEEDAEEIERIEALGWQVFTLDDFNGEPHFAAKTLYQAPGAAERERVEYHGMTSAGVEGAFPDLIPEETPFPVSDPDEE